MIGRFWRTLLAAASVRFWAMVGGAMALTVDGVWVTWIVAYHWPIGREDALRIKVLAVALFILLVGVILVVIALTGKRVEASGAWGRLDVSGGEETPPTVTTTITTKTETKP